MVTLIALAYLAESGAVTKTSVVGHCLFRAIRSTDFRISSAWARWKKENSEHFGYELHRTTNGKDRPKVPLEKMLLLGERRFPRRRAGWRRRGIHKFAVSCFKLAGAADSAAACLSSRLESCFWHSLAPPCHGLPKRAKIARIPRFQIEFGNESPASIIGNLNAATQILPSEL